MLCCKIRFNALTAHRRVIFSALAIVMVTVRSVASQQVVHAVTAEDLQQALLDHTVEHVVLTQHLDLSALNETLPFKVHGVQKTIRVRYQILFFIQDTWEQYSLLVHVLWLVPDMQHLLA